MSLVSLLYTALTVTVLVAAYLLWRPRKHKRAAGQNDGTAIAKFPAVPAGSVGVLEGPPTPIRPVGHLPRSTPFARITPTRVTASDVEEYYRKRLLGLVSIPLAVPRCTSAAELVPTADDAGGTGGTSVGGGATGSWDDDNKRLNSFASAPCPDPSPMTTY